MTLSCKAGKVSNYKLITDYAGINSNKNESVDHQIDRLMLLSEIAFESIRIRFICFGQLLIRFESNLRLNRK